MTRKLVFFFVVFLGFAIVSADIAAAKAARIRLRSGGKTVDTVVINETSSPPTITVSSGVTVRGASGSLLDKGNGEFEILVAGNASYHVKTRGGVDSVTVFDGDGQSRYWLGVGADDDTVTVYDGGGDDTYKIEGKGGDDFYQIVDDDGDDLYYLKGASGSDVFEIADGPGDDIYKLKARSEATLTVTSDAQGDEDFWKIKGFSYTP